MNRANPYAQYRQIATTTASPGQLVLMLYEGAVRFLERALEGFSMDDPGERNTTISNNLLKAQAIIDELNNALDVGAGGEFALTLRSLYNYFDRRLTESNCQKDPAGIRDVLRRVCVLRDAWKEMLAQGGACQLPLEASRAEALV
jgi:flagellar secretion chaperone FliS